MPKMLNSIVLTGFLPNLGPLEISVILILVLLIFGPKSLPSLGRALGQGLREFKGASSKFREEFEDNFKEDKEDDRHDKRERHDEKTKPAQLADETKKEKVEAPPAPANTVPSGEPEENR